MLDVHIARGRQPHRGRHRGAARGLPPLRGARGGRGQPHRRASRRSRRRRRPTPWNPGFCLGSMGIYIFDIDVLVRELLRDAEEDTSHDFGKDIIPKLVAGGERVYAYLFWDENKKESKYWRDVGTLDAYYEASMDLIQVDPVFNLYDPDWPHAHLPAAASRRPSSSSPRTGGAGVATAVDRVLGLHRLRQPGPALDPLPERARALVLRRRGLDPHAQRRDQPPRADPPRHRRPRRRGARGRRRSATIPPRTAAATP